MDDPRPHPHPTFLAGDRMPLGQAPAPVLDAIAELLTGQIDHIEDAVGGMAASPAAVVTDRSGRRLFVKACGERINRNTFRLYETEASIAEVVSGLPHVPSLVGTRRVDVDHSDGAEAWVVRAFEAVDGGCVATPWCDGDLRLVLDAWERTRAALWEREPPTGPSELAGILGRWADIAQDAGDPWHRLAEVWAPREATLLDQLQAPGRPAHLDLRADNILLDRSGEVWFVDWSHLQSSPPWTDPALLLFDVTASRSGAPLPDWVLRHPVFADAPDGAVDTLISSAAAFMHRGRDDVRPELPWNPRWKRAVAAALEPYVDQRPIRASQATARQAPIRQSRRSPFGRAGSSQS